MGLKGSLIKKLKYIIKFQMSSIKNCCAGNKPPTKASVCYSQAMIPLLCLHTAFVGGHIISFQYLMMPFIIGLLISLATFVAIRKYSYQAMIAIASFSLSNLMLYLILIFSEVQHGVEIATMTKEQRIQFSICCAGACQNFILPIISFWPYKEFKVGYFVQLDEMETKQKEQLEKKNNNHTPVVNVHPEQINQGDTTGKTMKKKKKEKEYMPPKGLESAAIIKKYLEIV